MTSQKLRCVARNVRRWAERYAEENDHPCDLNGVCAIAAGEVWKRLKALNANPVLCIAIYNPPAFAHCFVECSGYLIDVTATQYKGPKVLVRRKELAQSQSSHWVATWKCKTISDFYKEQVKEKWPDEQTVLI